MTLPAFFHSREVEEALAQAARAASMPVSLHVFDHGEETLKILAFDHCAMCRFVASLPGGASACRQSRGGAAAAALRRGTPMPFMCHMGFACVTVRALPELPFALTFGPYCPAEAPNTLMDDARAGLSNLGYDAEEDLPADLSDIRLVPAQAVPELALWAADTLAFIWDRAERLSTPPAPVVAEVVDERGAVVRHRGHLPGRDPYQSADLAAALAAGDRTHARRLVHMALAESWAGQHLQPAVRRARTLALAAATLEAATRAGLDTAGCWERFEAFLSDVHHAHNDHDLHGAALRLLRVLGRGPGNHPRAPSASGPSLKTLNRVVMTHLEEPLTLEEVARELGENPSTITHRLQRKLGMSFSQYVGRLRVDVAKDLLLRTQLRIEEVARRIGFEDVSNFRKLFHKFEGMSPRKYRERFNENK